MVVGAAYGAAAKPLSDFLSKKLLKNRSKEFKDEKTSFLIQLILSALLGGGIGAICGFTWMSLFLAALLFCGDVISTTDLQYRIIPNDMVLTLLGIKLLFGIPALFKVGGFPAWSPLLSLAGLAVLGVIFFLPSIFGGSIGFGDVKLAMAIGFCSELMPSLMAVALMGMLVLAVGTIQRKTSFGVFLKTQVPMGPFLCAAQVIALLMYQV